MNMIKIITAVHQKFNVLPRGELMELLAHHPVKVLVDSGQSDSIIRAPTV